jgi:hypothetical protein
MLLIKKSLYNKPGVTLLTTSRIAGLISFIL